ncbi:hypothetical protein [Rhodanobacter sp. DHB23]|uniref:hypothetical protein n=1 Tax=Rhodanobacter sp. DHB23 TaxID=2775923 RepID=UPI00177C4A1A|nr:hypothetical protein [Rhodanobacter sp. DHB23]MBD8873469.1 hypothetical protein [Rhodanobacter sp. DHB23]
MSPTARAQADAANDAYTNRPNYLHDNRPVYLGGSEYKIIGYRDDPATGFHATAYQSVATHEIIITYRGTDPAISDITGHTLTTIQDIAVDVTMVRDRINPQEAAASDFTRETIAKAEMQGISRDRITVAGHSLGGTLAEIEASRYGLRGATFNAYGAAGLGHGVPEGGSEVIDYVMAGDVVSAASRHHGRVVTLASPDDLASMRAGRYLDAPAGAQAPNPFLTMSLGDHSIKHFAPDPDDHATSVLDPATLTRYGKNYADNKAAIDAYRNDVYREREELSVALRQAQDHDAHAQLPADIRRQLDEYLAANVDPAIRRKIEQNSVVQDVEHGLQTGADALRAGGRYAQSRYERAAAAVHAAGSAAAPANPVAPLAGAVIGEAAHLQGQAAGAVGDLAADGLEAARQTIGHGAHDAAQAINGAIHAPGLQATTIHLVNGVVDTYRTAENVVHTAEQAFDHARQSVSHGMDAARQAGDDARQAVAHGVDDARHTAARACDDARQAMAHGIDAVVHAANTAYDALTHAESWIGRGTTPSPAPQPRHARTDPTAESLHTRDDPRHPANPDHALYRELHERIPAASEKRLLQFTAACHAGGITHDNIGPIAYDEHRGIMHFMTASELRPPVAVDVKAPSPDPQHSIQQIQLANQPRPPVHGQPQTQGAQIGQ